MEELTDEQLKLIEANREQAKRRRLERYLEGMEKAAEVERTAEEEPFVGGGFIPEVEDEGQEFPLVDPAGEIVFPLELNESCCVCGSYDLDEFIRRHYKVAVCPSCRSEHPERFDLVTKTSAQDQFLLTDEELRDSERLPHVSRPNPLQPRWSNMKLYLKEHLVAFAREKWAGVEGGLEGEAQRRADAQHELKERKFAANLKELRRKTVKTVKARKSSGAAVSAKHRHTFENVKDATTGSMRSICTECGISLVTEEL